VSASPDDPVPPGRERRRHDRGDLLSTDLLLELTTITVDPAYIEAAARRAHSGAPPSRSRGPWGALLLFLIGLLLVVAVRQTRHTAPQAARVRAGLLQRVERLTARTDESGRQLDRLRTQLAADRDSSLARSASDRSLRDKVRALELEVGAAPVAGNGVVVVLSDADASTEAYAEGRVQDRDLQQAVNALWAAGAEAVAINGQRAGALTAIRQAGESILVDYRPIASPYRVSAIGERDSLETGFVVSPAAARFRRLQQLYRIGFEIRRADKLELPGAASTRVLVAKRAGSAPQPSGGAGGKGR
jgi:uncharacterized protein YlxW (UPF0749 family)